MNAFVRKKPLLIALTLLLALLVGLVYWQISNQNDLEPEAVLRPLKKTLKIHSPELQAIAQDLRLTDEGLEVLDSIDDVFLYYKQPSVLAACGFATTANLNTIVEGCYDLSEADISYADSNGNDRFDGNEAVKIAGDIMIVSSESNIADTMAHEFLHAVYIRMSADEKAELNTLLSIAYANNQTKLDDLLAAYDLGSGDEDLKLNELHSFIGTKIPDPADALEKHYARYFQDRSEIVKLSQGLPAPPHADNPEPEPQVESEPESESSTDAEPQPEPEPEPQPSPAPSIDPLKIELNHELGLLMDRYLEIQIANQTRHQQDIEVILSEGCQYYILEYTDSPAYIDQGEDLSQRGWGWTWDMDDFNRRLKASPYDFENLSNNNKRLESLERGDNNQELLDIIYREVDNCQL